MIKQICACTGKHQILVVGLFLVGAISALGLFFYLNHKEREIKGPDVKGPEVKVPDVPKTTPPPVRVALAALHTGASAEEVERLVTVPLEINLAGMPGLRATYSWSQAGLARLDCEFAAGVKPFDAQQEVINRLGRAVQVVQLPSGVEAM